MWRIFSAVFTPVFRLFVYKYDRFLRSSSSRSTLWSSVDLTSVFRYQVSSKSLSLTVCVSTVRSVHNLNCPRPLISSFGFSLVSGVFFLSIHFLCPILSWVYIFRTFVTLQLSDSHITIYSYKSTLIILQYISSTSNKEINYLLIILLSFTIYTQFPFHKYPSFHFKLIDRLCANYLPKADVSIKYLIRQFHSQLM